MAAKIGFVSYAPGILGSESIEALTASLQAELGAVAATFDTITQGTVLTLRNVAPTKTKPLMLVYADGTNWNPGSGEGVYIRNVANSAWKFLG